MNILSGKCPGCGLVPQRLNLQLISAGQAFGAGVTYNCVSYVCPNVKCQTILGVQMDPLAVKTDTVNAVAKKLGR